MGTSERLVEAAAALLDQGGESAVTLRAVSHAVGVSHNAPYKHFDDRAALLAAVAIRDFGTLAASFRAILRTRRGPRKKLQEALTAFTSYGRANPARYRLLFSDPEIGRRGGDLELAALGAFAVFASIVEEFQAETMSAAVPARDVAGLIYAAVHGLIDLEASGRMREQNGLQDADQGIGLLLDLVRPGRPSRRGAVQGVPIPPAALRVAAVARVHRWPSGMAAA